MVCHPLYFEFFVLSNFTIDKSKEWPKVWLVTSILNVSNALTTSAEQKQIGYMDRKGMAAGRTQMVIHRKEAKLSQWLSYRPCLIAISVDAPISARLSNPEQPAKRCGVRSCRTRLLGRMLRIISPRIDANKRSEPGRLFWLIRKLLGTMFRILLTKEPLGYGDSPNIFTISTGLKTLNRYSF